MLKLLHLFDNGSPPMPRDGDSRILPTCGNFLSDNLGCRPATLPLNFFTPPDLTGSSNPPGRNGQFPDLPRTNARAALGRRVRDVEVTPVMAFGTRTYY